MKAVMDAYGKKSRVRYRAVTYYLLAKELRKASHVQVEIALHLYGELGGQLFIGGCPFSCVTARLSTSRRPKLSTLWRLRSLTEDKRPAKPCFD